MFLRCFFKAQAVLFLCDGLLFFGVGLAHQQVSEVVKITETPNRVADPGRVNHQQEAKDGIRISGTGHSRE